MVRKGSLRASQIIENKASITCFCFGDERFQFKVEGELKSGGLDGCGNTTQAGAPMKVKHTTNLQIRRQFFHRRATHAEVPTHLEPITKPLQSLAPGNPC